MRIARSVTLAFLATLALGASLAFPAQAAAQHRIERSAQLDHDGEFRIWNFVGSIRVVGWDVDSVRVEGTLDDVARRAFAFGASGAAGKMSTADQGVSGRADLLIRVPRGASIQVKSMSAPIVVLGVEGALDVHSVTGDVHIETSASSVYGESMGGRVRVLGGSRVVRLRSGSGPLEFAGTADDLSLTSVSGDIAAHASGLRRGIVETVGGRVRLGLALAPDAALEVLTHDGDVDLSLPRSVDADFTLRTVSGALRSELPADGRPSATALSGREAAFRAGRGGADVQVRTFSGAIVVRAAPAVPR